jgi:phosphoribosyl-AMP cyclohydrolase
MPGSYRRAIAQKTQETGLFTESARCKEVFWLKNPVSGHPSVQGYKSEVTDIDEPALQIRIN